MTTMKRVWVFIYSFYMYHVTRIVKQSGLGFFGEGGRRFNFYSYFSLNFTMIVLFNWDQPDSLNGVCNQE